MLVICVGVTVISKTKEGSLSSEQDQSIGHSLFFFFCKEDVVPHGHNPKGQIVTRQYNMEVLHSLCNAVISKQPDICSMGL